MGSDDLHHKRKQRDIKSLGRKSKNRSPRETVLIVCEGEKTERHYFQGLKDELKLTNLTIKGLGFDPKTLLSKAVKMLSEDSCDRLYCVFDKDEHLSYQETVNTIEQYRNRKRGHIPVHAITSVPCFEYWLLLHFKESTSPYEKTGNKSTGEKIVSDLKKYIPNYSKEDRDIFEKTKAHLDNAIKRAKKVRQQQKDNGTDNPSTKVHELVEYLKKLQDR